MMLQGLRCGSASGMRLGMGLNKSSLLSFLSPSSSSLLLRRTLASQVQIFVSESHDPFINLATEEWILQSAKHEETKSYLIYRNQPSVVIGRYQNPWRECNLPEMEKHGVNFVRRRSGGGTVYHDLGNVNLSFFSPRKSFDKTSNSAFMVRVLTRLGVPAGEGSLVVNERSDLVFQNHKISGSAYRLTSNHAYHHCTLLLEADIIGLKKFLHVPKKNIQGRGVDSVKSPVTNLCDGTRHFPFDAIVEAFAAQAKEENPGLTHRVIKLQDSLLRTNPFVDEGVEALMSWDWRHGQTPPFVHTLDNDFSWGYVKLSIPVDDGIIKTPVFECVIPEFSMAVESFLDNKPYDEVVLRKQLLSISESRTDPYEKDKFVEICRWMTDAL